MQQRNIAEYRFRSMFGSEGEAVTSGPGVIPVESVSAIERGVVEGFSRFLKVVAMQIGFEIVSVL
jgi:hypothetical protein